MGTTSEPRWVHKSTSWARRCLPGEKPFARPPAVILTRSPGTFRMRKTQGIATGNYELPVPAICTRKWFFLPRTFRYVMTTTGTCKLLDEVVDVKLRTCRPNP